MTQQIATFGPNGTLLGVLSMPKDIQAGAPVVLLTNSGVLSRQGPHRINVRIAHALQDAGIPTLRFDLSGHGDSQPIANVDGDRVQAVADMKSAMDWVQKKTSISRFYVFGICSGAVNAYDAAQADERVAGIMMLDGLWYRSRWTLPMRHYKRAKVVGWGGSIAAVRRRIFPNSSSDQAVDAAPVIDFLPGDDAYGNPPKPAFVKTMQRLIERGTSVFFIYGGSVLDYYSYNGQFKHVFGRHAFFPHVRCEYHPEIDHTLISRHAQKRLIELICDWVRSGIARRDTKIGLR